MGCQFHAILICYLDVKPHKSILNSQAEQKLLLLQDRTAEFSMTWKALNMDFYCCGRSLFPFGLYSVEEDGVFTYRMA